MSKLLMNGLEESTGEIQHQTIPRTYPYNSYRLYKSMYNIEKSAFPFPPPSTLPLHRHFDSSQN